MQDYVIGAQCSLPCNERKLGYCDTEKLDDAFMIGIMTLTPSVLASLHNHPARERKRKLRARGLSPATCRTGTKVCPKASHFRCITTLVLVSKYPQTHCKKFSSREISKAHHGDGRGEKQKRGDEMQRRLFVLSGVKALFFKATDTSLLYYSANSNNIPLKYFPLKYFPLKYFPLKYFPLKLKIFRQLKFYSAKV